MKAKVRGEQTLICALCSSWTLASSIESVQLLQPTLAPLSNLCFDLLWTFNLVWMMMITIITIPLSTIAKPSRTSTGLRLLPPALSGHLIAEVKVKGLMNSLAHPEPVPGPHLG